MRGNTRGLMESALASVIFGFSNMFNTLGFKWISPVNFLAMRFTIAFIGLNLLILTGRLSISLKGKPVHKLLLLGFIQPVIGFLCDNYGIYYTSASFAGSMVALAPIVSLMLGVLIMHEHITPVQAVSAVVAVIGAAILNADTSGGGRPLKGVLLVLGSVITGRTYLMMSKSFSDCFSSTERTYVQLGIGSAAFCLMAAVRAASSGVDWKFADQPEFWISVLYLAILASLVAYLLQNHSIELISNTQSGIMAMLVPVISVLSGVFILHEDFSLRQMLGVVLILVSVYGATHHEELKAEKAGR